MLDIVVTRNVSIYGNTWYYACYHQWVINRCPEIFRVWVGIIHRIGCFYDAELRPTFYLARYHYYIFAEETALRLYELLLWLKESFMFHLIVTSHLNQFDVGSMMYQAIWYLQPRKHHTFTDWVNHQNVEIFLHKSCRSKFFQFEIIINSFSALSASFEYLYYGSTTIINIYIFSVRIIFWRI